MTPATTQQPTAAEIALAREVLIALADVSDDPSGSSQLRAIVQAIASSKHRPRWAPPTPPVQAPAAEVGDIARIIVKHAPYMTNKDTTKKIAQALADREAAARAEIERLTIENWQLKGALGYPVPGNIPEGQFKCGLCEAKTIELLELRARTPAQPETKDL